MKFKISELLCLVSLLAALLGFADERYVLRYDTPANHTFLPPRVSLTGGSPERGDMQTALPLGNGRLGAMFSGGIDTENLLINDITLWMNSKRGLDMRGRKAVMVKGIHLKAASITMAEANGCTLSDLGVRYVTPFERVAQKVGAFHDGSSYNDWGPLTPGPTGVIRDGTYKLRISEGEVELYDLRNDLSETTNIADALPEKVQSMRARWIDWKKGNAPDLWEVADNNAYQYADYEWLKGSQHYKGGK